MWLFDGADGGKWVEDIKERYNNSTNGGTAQAKSQTGPEAKRTRVS